MIQEKKSVKKKKAHQIHGNSQSIIYLHGFAIVILETEIM